MEAQVKQARSVHVDEDGHAIMMAQNTNQGFGASSSDANYIENLRHVVDGGREKGY
jgi:hypothetical protein